MRGCGGSGRGRGRPQEAAAEEEGAGRAGARGQGPPQVVLGLAPRPPAVRLRGPRGRLRQRGRRQQEGDGRRGAGHGHMGVPAWSLHTAAASHDAGWRGRRPQVANADSPGPGLAAHQDQLSGGEQLGAPGQVPRVARAAAGAREEPERAVGARQRCLVVPRGGQQEGGTAGNRREDDKGLSQQCSTALVPPEGRCQFTGLRGNIWLHPSGCPVVPEGGQARPG